MLNPVARRKPNRLRRRRVQFDRRLNRDARREEIIRHRLLAAHHRDHDAVFTPDDKAVRAVSNRAGVPVEDITAARGSTLSPRPVTRRSWRVRQVTNWSCLRLGRFFARDHATVLHSLQRMKGRAGRDPDLGAYIAKIP